MCPKDAYGKANIVDPGQTVPLEAVCTVCPGWKTKEHYSIHLKAHLI